MPKFNVTYEIVTEESAEHGDADERGFISQDVSLRQALEDVFKTRTSHCDGITGIEDNNGAWFTVYNGMEFLTGAHESRSIHMPDNITGSSISRIAKLMGA